MSILYDFGFWILYDCDFLLELRKREVVGCFAVG